MFEIGFPELILIAIIGLLVIGPERLPEALRTLGLWIGRMRRSFSNVKTEIEKEIGMDEIRRQLHNEAVMEEMKRIERDVRDSVNSGASNRRPAGTEPAATGEEQNSPASTPDTPGEQTGSDAADSAESEAAPPRQPGPSEQPSSDRSEPDRSAPSSADDRHHG